jgi:hypothetical protein
MSLGIREVRDPCRDRRPSSAAVAASKGSSNISAIVLQKRQSVARRAAWGFTAELRGFGDTVDKFDRLEIERS